MSDQLVVSESAMGYLNATRPWVKFLAILGFIGMTLMAIAGLFMILGLSAVPMKPGAPAFSPLVGLIYLVFIAFYFMPCLFLYRYGKAISAIPGTGQSAFEDALRHQKSFWKFIGIFTLVMLSLELLFIVIGVLTVLAVHH